MKALGLTRICRHWRARPYFAIFHGVPSARNLNGNPNRSVVAFASAEMAIHLAELAGWREDVHASQRVRRAGNCGKRDTHFSPLR
jgi:hypothetical protein